MHIHKYISIVQGPKGAEESTGPHRGSSVHTCMYVYISMHKICTLVTSSLVDVNEIIRIEL